MIDQKMWEILVPTQFNDGRPIRTRMHREWDRRILRISGGLTVLKPAKGQWVSPEGTLFKERMIPVRIVATKEQIDKIIDVTMKFYEQEAVLCYAVANEVLLVHKK